MTDILSHTSSTPLSDDALHAHFTPLFASIAEGAVAREQRRELPHECVQALLKAGFGRLRIPRSEGGFGVSLSQLMQLLQALARADSNVAQIFRAHSAFVEGEQLVSDRRVRELWFPKIVAGEMVGAAMSERIAGTDITLRMSADPAGGWRLNGRKFYCTGALYADWMTAYAAVDGTFAVAMVSTTAPGVERVDDWDGFGQRLTASGSTLFDDVRVPEEHFIRYFEPSSMPAEQYMSAYFQLYHLATLSGIVAATFDDGVRYARERTRTFRVPGVSSPKDDPLVQRVIGRLASIAYASEALVQQAARALDRANRAIQEGLESQEEVSPVDVQVYQAQQIILSLALEATSLVFEVGGASAVSNSRQLDRHWRNARTLASHNPASQREQALGDFYLNGVTPTAALQTLRDAAKGKGQGAAGTLAV